MQIEPPELQYDSCIEIHVRIPKQTRRYKITAEFVLL